MPLILFGEQSESLYSPFLQLAISMDVVLLHCKSNLAATTIINLSATLVENVAWVSFTSHLHPPAHGQAWLIDMLEVVITCYVHFCFPPYAANILHIIPPHLKR